MTITVIIYRRTFINPDTEKVYEEGDKLKRVEYANLVGAIKHIMFIDRGIFSCKNWQILVIHCICFIGEELPKKSQTKCKNTVNILMQLYKFQAAKHSKIFLFSKITHAKQIAIKILEKCYVTAIWT